MALTAAKAMELLEELQDFLAMKASEDLMEGPEPGMHEEPDGDEGGMAMPPVGEEDAEKKPGVVIAIKPKGGGNPHAMR